MKAIDQPLSSAIEWLDSQTQPYRVSEKYELGGGDTSYSVPPSGAFSIVSFDIPYSNPVWHYVGQYKRSWAYDNALGIIVYSLIGDFDNARGLLRTMEHLQNADGSIGFSWNTFDDGFYNGSYKRTGSIAWAGYAAVIYEQCSGDKQFRRFAEKTADYVLSQQVTIPEDLRFGLFKGGHGYWTDDYKRMEDRPAEWCAMEHQIDCYFFLRDLGLLTGNSRYGQAAELLKRRTMEVLWNESEGRFNVGVDGKQVNTELALDASSWGAIFLTAIGEVDKAHRALAFVERAFSSDAELNGRRIQGYKAYAGQHYSDHPMHNWAQVRMVWSEGSLGVALAHLKLGNIQRCREILAEICGMQNTEGGLRYSWYADDIALPATALKPIPIRSLFFVGGRTYRVGEVQFEPTDRLHEFLRSPSVAGTAWYALAAWSIPNNKDIFWGPDADIGPSVTNTSRRALWYYVRFPSDDDWGQMHRLEKNAMVKLTSQDTVLFRYWSGADWTDDELAPQSAYSYQSNNRGGFELVGFPAISVESIHINYPADGQAVERSETVSGKCTGARAGWFVRAWTLPVGDMWYLMDSMPAVSADGRWEVSNCLFGRVGPIDYGKKFHLRVELCDEAGRVMATATCKALTRK